MTHLKFLFTRLMQTTAKIPIGAGFGLGTRSVDLRGCVILLVRANAPWCVHGSVVKCSPQVGVPGSSPSRRTKARGTTGVKQSSPSRPTSIHPAGLLRG